MTKRPDDIPIHPHKWLLLELPKYLDGEALDQIMADHRIVKRRYDLSSKLRAERTILRTFQRAYANSADDRRSGYAVKIARKQARIQAIEKELAEL